VDVVLTKGSTPEAGKWEHCDLEVMIEWFRRDGDKSMPNNKEGLLRYRKTHTHTVHDGGTYQYDDVAAAVTDCQEAFRSHSASASQTNSKTFALVLAGSQAAAYVAPTHVAPTIVTNGTVAYRRLPYALCTLLQLSKS
jgi:hypothetical protein